MTWLLGGAGKWSAFLLADTRVTLPNGLGHRDWAQKIHFVRQNLIVGFAGSTTIGFDIADQLAFCSELDDLPILYEIAREFLPHKLRTIFEKYPEEERHLRSEILFAGAGLRQPPVPDLPPMIGGWKTAVKFASPGFEPEFCWPPRSIVSSGSSPDRLRALQLDGAVERPGFSPGVALRLLAIIYANHLRDALQEVPEEHVSDQFMIGVVSPQGNMIEPFVSFSSLDDRVVRHGPTRIANTLDALMRMVEADEDLRPAKEHSGTSLRLSTV